MKWKDAFDLRAATPVTILTEVTYQPVSFGGVQRANIVS